MQKKIKSQQRRLSLFLREKDSAVGINFGANILTLSWINPNHFSARRQNSYGNFSQKWGHAVDLREYENDAAVNCPLSGSGKTKGM